MKRMLVVVAVAGIAAGCKGSSAPARESEQVAKSGAKTGSGTTTNSGSGSGSGKSKRDAEVELLHATKSKVAVSSVVANNTIFPTDLVDGKLDTAWNSRTGDLTTGWIEFRVPREAHVSKIRLTAGFATFHGKDDYFTMNYRIRAVHVKRLGVDGDLGVHPLDPDNRGLQDIAIDGPGGDFKIEITDVVAGTKKNWRELCVSELQVWGTPPPGVTPRHEAPEVAIGSLDTAPPPDLDVQLVSLPDFASIADYCKTYLARPAADFGGCPAIDEQCKADAVATCGEVASTKPAGHPVAEALAPLPDGWSAATYFYTTAAHSKALVCNVAITAGARTYVLEAFAVDGCGAARGIADSRQHTRHEVQLAGDLLAILGTTGGYAQYAFGSETTDEKLWLCGGATPACAFPVDVAEYVTTYTSGGEPGADGLSVDTTGWSLDWKLDGKRLVLSHQDGTLDENTHAQLGAHRIVMPE